MTDKNMVANPVTLKPMFEADEAMKEVGGPAYLAQLTGSGAAVIGARDFAAQIYDLALLRALVGVGRDMVEGALDTSEDVAPLGQIERGRDRALPGRRGGRRRRQGQELRRGDQGWRSRWPRRRSTAAAASVGHHHRPRRDQRQDRRLHKSDLIILAGRPGMGKTSLATNIAFAAAQRFVRDQEDGIEPAKSAGAAGRLLQPRNVGRPARHPHPRRAVGDQLRESPHGQDQPAGVSATSPAPRPSCQTLPLYIDDTPGLTIAALRARARRLKRQKGIGMIVVDYLQLLQGTGKNSNDNRVQEISEISRGLKQLAKELDVPVMALSQLSRAVEQREDKRPQLSDLRESGSIEQDADIVCSSIARIITSPRASPSGR
jgi:replicative DNA helicase